LKLTVGQIVIASFIINIMLNDPMQTLKDNNMQQTDRQQKNTRSGKKPLRVCIRLNDWLSILFIFFF